MRRQDAAATAALRIGREHDDERDELGDDHHREQRRQAAELRQPAASRRPVHALRPSLPLGGLQYDASGRRVARRLAIQARRSAISGGQTWCAIG